MVVANLFLLMTQATEVTAIFWNRITERTRVRPIRRFAPKGRLHRSSIV